MFAKTDVNGKDTCEAYQFLRMHSELYDSGKKVAKEIPWNFAKFVVNSDGHVMSYHPPTTSPDDIVPEIRGLLGL